MAQTSEFYTKAKVDELLGAVDMTNIVDSHGNKRFVEWNLNTQPSEGITFNYTKASLSGTHLMIVIAGTMLKGDYTTRVLADVYLPSYIASKIYPSVGNAVEFKNVLAYGSDFQTQNLKIDLYILETKLVVSLGAPITNTADRTFRIQFDLLIDSE